MVFVPQYTTFWPLTPAPGHKKVNQILAGGATTSSPHRVNAATVLHRDVTLILIASNLHATYTQLFIKETINLTLNLKAKSYLVKKYSDK